jgi:hypothetical protein
MKSLQPICLLLYLFLSLSATLILAQNPKMSDDELGYKINKLLNEYSINAGFTEDGETLSPVFRQRFMALFAKNAKVYNELPGTPNFGKRQALVAYADELSEWYPAGLRTDLSKPTILRRGVHEDLNYDSVYVVSAVKTFSGTNKDGITIDKQTKKLFFVLGYDKDKDKLVITAISNMEDAAVNLAEMRAPKSKQKEDDNPPLQLGIGIMPGIGNIIGDISSANALFYEDLSGLQQSITFSFGAHAYLLLGIGARMQWGVGLGTSRLLRRLSLDSYTGSYQATDKDGENYTRNVSISNFTEEYRQSAMNVPLFIRYSITKTSSLTLFTDVGVAFGLNVTGKHSYGGTFSAYNSYERTEPENYTFTLRSLDGEAFTGYNNHYGLYDDLVINNREIIQADQLLTLKSLQAALLVAIGSSFKLSNRLLLFGTVRTQMGITDINNSPAKSGQRMLLPNANQYNSIMSALGSPLRPVTASAEIGILFNLKN